MEKLELLLLDTKNCPACGATEERLLEGYMSQGKNYNECQDCATKWPLLLQDERIEKLARVAWELKEALEFYASPYGTLGSAVAKDALNRAEEIAGE